MTPAITSLSNVCPMLKSATLNRYNFVCRYYRISFSDIVHGRQEKHNAPTLWNLILSKSVRVKCLARLWSIKIYIYTLGHNYCINNYIDIKLLFES